MTSAQSPRRLLNTVLSRKAPSIAIYVDSGQCALLKGATRDASPAILRVRVVLDLLETTSIRNVSLSFRGYASMSSVHGSPDTTVYDICNEEWPLLSSASPLVAGRHTFPFEVIVGGSLPASTSEPFTSGGVSVHYDLRAFAVCRDKRHPIMSPTKPVQLMRSLPADALEFQQSLEYEAAVHGQIMYSLSIPHKTWAAGETLSAAFRASVLAKGAVLRQIRTLIIETRRTLGGQPHVTTIASKILPVHREEPSGGVRRILRANSAKSLRRIPSVQLERATTTSGVAECDISVVLTVAIPPTTAPSSAIEPIVVEHNVRCTFDLVSAAGKVSSIDCQLPIHILDHRLLAEAVAATMESRICALGSAAERSRQGLDRQEHTPPCYAAHMRDRVFCAGRPPSMRIPSYEIASSEFVAGMPPLDLLRQLPGYVA